MRIAPGAAGSQDAEIPVGRSAAEAPVRTHEARRLRAGGLLERRSGRRRPEGRRSSTRDAVLCRPCPIETTTCPTSSGRCRWRAARARCSAGLHTLPGPTGVHRICAPAWCGVTVFRVLNGRGLVRCRPQPQPRAGGVPRGRTDPASRLTSTYQELIVARTATRSTSPARRCQVSVRPMGIIARGVGSGRS